MSDTQSDNFSYESDPDVLLMLEFQRGDQASFENLMRKYYKRIFNFLYRLLGDRSSSEDLTQETFLKIYRAAPRYQPHSKFQTWIYTIAKNAALNEMRRKKPVFSLESPVRSERGDSMLRQMEDTDAPEPAEDLHRQEMARRVQEAVGRLPKNQRMVVILYRYERLSYEQIAQSMGMSVSAVKSLLSRARENLRHTLRPFIDE